MTYNSICHAVNCAALKERDVSFGPCIKKDPCTHHHCTSGEICTAMNYGPCLVMYSRAGRKLPCRQYICGQCILLVHLWSVHFISTSVVSAFY